MNDGARTVPAVVAAALLAAAATAHAQKRYEIMDYGPYLMATFEAEPKGNFTYKGLAIRLGGDQQAAVLFDTETMRMAAGWTGGFVRMTGIIFDGKHGSAPGIGGEQKFGSLPGPGWASGESFQDPRPRPYGPLPADWAKYKGLFLHEQRVVLYYSVAGADVLELPAFETAGETAAFTRTLQINRSSAPLSMLVCENADATGSLVNIAPAGQIAVLAEPPRPAAKPSPGKPARAVAEELTLEDGAVAAPEYVTAVGIIAGPTGARLAIDGNTRIHLRLPALASVSALKLAIWHGPRAELPAFARFLRQATDVADLRALCRGGPPRWGQTVTTTGTLGSDATAYTVDTLTLPYDNPWRSWMRTGAFDFFSDGTRAAVSTWSGDVWIVSGIDDKLDNLQWKRFATGLFQPLGLKIVEDKIYTLGRDGITRLHDLNGNGEADFYENFNNDVQVTANFHEFAFELHTDSKGNFYFVKGGPVRPGGRGWHEIVAHHGCVLKVSRDGGKLEVFATGLRAPNGMGIGPGDIVTVSDNEGTWVPTSPLSIARPGGFLGVKDLSHRDPPPEIYDPRICWIPKSVCNSNGGQGWVSGEKWGPLKDRLLYSSYGKSSLFHVLIEQVDGIQQGGVERFPLRFDSGIMRVRQNPRDGQMYVCGLKGWQSNAAREGALHRVRYTGKPVTFASHLHVTDAGIYLGFFQPLDPAAATNLQNYSLEQWNYRWTSAYGSPEFSVANPDKRGRDKIVPTGASISADRRTVFLEIPDLQPVMQMRIRFNLRTAAGEAVNSEIHNTINRVGPSAAIARGLGPFGPLERSLPAAALTAPPPANK
jgi:hypothetical protein